VRAPTHTLCPDAWSVWADSLYDAGAPDADVLHARQIALALAGRPRLVLLSSPNGFALRPGYLAKFFTVPSFPPSECRWVTLAWKRAQLLGRGMPEDFVTSCLRGRLLTPWHLPRPRPPELVRAWFDTLPQLLEPGPPGGV
jgi:hypothetical protein